MRQYPIWNKITACIYKAGKSYGVKNNGEVEIFVGTSSSNSHAFVTHAVTHREHENGDREYRFHIDGDCVKRAILRKGRRDLEFMERVTDGDGCHFPFLRREPV
jgi:hypothetical protein|tara:strand:- start:631 stop:942 length:312 start_codon:yes stop_codon:yes gene_type:complete